MQRTAHLAAAQIALFVALRVGAMTSRRLALLGMAYVAFYIWQLAGSPHQRHRTEHKVAGARRAQGACRARAKRLAAVQNV